MDPGRFTSDRYGTVVKTPGRFGYYTFLPAQVPRSLTLDEGTISALSEADRALGRLAGAGRLLPNPHLLVNAYLRREAVSSSRIEGTQATISEVFDAESRGAIEGDVQEVVNYINALEAGILQLDSLPISKRLIESIHAVLMSDVRGDEKLPGEIRSTPNWIGSPDNSPATAVFVPPPPDEMRAGLSDWERFVHDDIAMPSLIRCALMHYQFETLHPFLDGNGRLGRLLIVFFLLSNGDLPEPLLYVSAYFEEHKDEYYDRLQAVRERGDLSGWLRFFLGAIATQANDAVSRAEQLTDLREQFRLRLHGSRSRAHELIDLLLQNPYLTTSGASKALGVTPQGAMNLLRQLEGAGILRPLPRIPGRSNRWVAAEVLQTLTNSSAA